MDNSVLGGIGRGPAGTACGGIGNGPAGTTMDNSALGGIGKGPAGTAWGGIGSGPAGTAKAEHAKTTSTTATETLITCIKLLDIMNHTPKAARPIRTCLIRVAQKGHRC
jgi:hypothetical protein